MTMHQLKNRNNIRFRSGKNEDALEIAKLINIASDGLIEYLFDGVVPGVTPVQIIASQHAGDKEHPPGSFTAVAAVNSKVIGVIYSYHASYHRITEETRKHIPAKRLKNLEDFYSSRIESSWYLSSLAVNADYRRQGIGKHLLQMTKDYAILNDYSSLSLIVTANNKGAISFYNRIGFQIVRSIDLPGDLFKKHSNCCFLMKADL